MEEGKNPDAAIINDLINQKTPPKELREALTGNQSKIESSGEQLKEILLECIVSRTRKSLEHLKRIIEFYYNEVMQPFFLRDTIAES